MAIRVKHGEGNIGALLQLALTAGQGQQQFPQAPQLSIGAPARGSPGGSGGGIRHSGRVAGIGQVTRVTRSPEEMAELEVSMARDKAEALLPIKAQEMEERAKLEAEGWEEKYSIKARQDIARSNEAMQRIRQGVARGEIDPETGVRMLSEVAAIRDGVTKEWFPPDPNKPAKEQMPGYKWTDEQGNKMANNEKGRPIILQPWYDTPEGRQQQQQMDLELEEARRETGRLNARETTRAKLANELISIRTAEGADTEKKRYREPWEIERDLERAHPTPAPDPTQEELTAKFYRDHPEKVARPEGRPGQLTQAELGGMQIRRTLINDAEKNFGLAFSPSDRKALENAAPEVSESIVYLRAVESRYGSIAEAPTKVRLEAEAAMRLLRREGNAGIQ